MTKRKMFRRQTLLLQNKAVRSVVWLPVDARPGIDLFPNWQILRFAAGPSCVVEHSPRLIRLVANSLQASPLTSTCRQDTLEREALVGILTPVSSCRHPSRLALLLSITHLPSEAPPRTRRDMQRSTCRPTQRTATCLSAPPCWLA